MKVPETKIILMGKELKKFKLVEFSTHDDWEATRYTIEGFIQKTHPKPKKVEKPVDILAGKPRKAARNKKK